MECKYSSYKTIEHNCLDEITELEDSDNDYSNSSDSDMDICDSFKNKNLYGCDICSYTNSRAYNITIHRRTHFIWKGDINNSNHVYVCNKCDCKSISQIILDGHSCKKK